MRTPCTSLWSCTGLKNGDIAVAANTGMVYIFSANKDRYADVKVLESFDIEVANQMALEMEAIEKQQVLSV